MMNKKIASRMLTYGPLVPLLLFTLIGFTLLELYLAEENEMRFKQELNSLARIGTRMLPHVVSPDDINGFDVFADAFAADGRIRVSIIDMNGTMLGDSKLSRNEIDALGTLLGRPEIEAAHQAGTGTARRFSDTMQAEMLFAAVYFKNEIAEGYFRVAVAVAEVERVHYFQQEVVVVFFILSLAGLSVVSLLMSRISMSSVQHNQKVLERTVQARNDEIQVLQNLGTQLTACNKIEEALEIAALVTSKALPRFMGMVGLLRASRDKVERVIEWNGEWSGEKHFLPDDCWAIRTGKSYLGNPSAGKIMCAHHEEQNGFSVCIPLLAQGDLLGVMQFAAASLNDMTSEERQMASAVAESVSLSLASLRSRENLRQQAIRDPLTGLYNRRYLMDAMEHELSRSIRHKLSLSVLVLDVDHFKNFNDRHGHHAGDYVLKELGRLLKNTIRTEDIACRYGGEEFVVLLPDTKGSDAIPAAERICKNIRKKDFVHEGNSLGLVTISIGAACYPEHAADANGLIKKADEALYVAKQNGRDRVVSARDS